MLNLKSQILNCRLLILGYLISIVGLFFYSFTQVDLGLTLTRWSVWQVLQRLFQNIGYFNRPLSTFFYILIICLLFLFYLLILFFVNRRKNGKKELWFLILITTVILTFSYNAFSYDLFNYIFDAKIVTYYQQNPYLHKALDYPGDPMLSFMHWTHRVYPYGPVWLISTIPLSYLGMQLFLPTAIFFKIFISVSFLGTVFFIGKIMKKIAPDQELFSIAFFALNPLVIIESLVSAHNDILMMFFTVLAFYLLLTNKYFWSLCFLLLSIGVKFATALFIPVFVAIAILIIKKKPIPWDKIFFFSIILMMTTIIFASVRTNFQPWYLLYVLPFTIYSAKKYYIFIPTVIISFFALLQYIPFLYLGNWNPPVPQILFYFLISSMILSLIFTLIWRYKIIFSHRQIKC